MPYFCQEQKEEYFKLAQPAEGNAIIERQDTCVFLP